MIRLPMRPVSCRLERLVMLSTTAQNTAGTTMIAIAFIKICSMRLNTFSCSHSTAFVGSEACISRPSTSPLSRAARE